jgi:hypothetical protein
MRSILFGILALSALIVVSALGSQFFVPPNSAGPDLQVFLPRAHAQGAGKSQGNVPQAPVGHRQPTAQGVQGVQKGSSTDRAVKKADDNLKKKLQGICRGC